MTPTVPAVALARALTRLTARLEALEARLDDDESLWPLYETSLSTLVAVLSATRPEAGGPLLTTGQLAARLGVSTKTILRKRANGTLTPAMTLGKRGRAALRWGS